MAQYVVHYPIYDVEVTQSTPNPITVLDLELLCYRKGNTNYGKAGHLRRISEILWGPKSNFHFVWNPWAEKMNEVVHQHPVTKELCPDVALSGCANSNKSCFGALYALVNWLCDPLNTFVFITSTSISDSKHRVWKPINKMFNAVKGLPGTLVDSKAKIVTVQPGGKHDDTAGIFIVAGAPGKERDGIGKLIGKKNKRVILIADELPELSPAVLDARANLLTNPFFQFIAMGNFKSREDPFGELVEPEDGWDSINIDSEEWQCKGGAYCVRFDGVKSPNIRAGKDIYPHIYNSKNLKEHRSAYGENSALFMRMVRSFETAIGYENTIYSESDFTTAKAYDPVIWLGDVTRVASADPAFTNGGDRFVLYFGKYGMSKDGVMTLMFDHYKILHEDVRIANTRNRSFQMADQIKKDCEDWGVKPQHFGLDATATGRPFADVVDEVWTPGKNSIYRVDFSGSPTDRIATQDGKLAKDAYDRRVTEIWMVGKEFLKGQQLKGLCKEAAREAKARRYETIKGAEGLKVKAETKPDMKERLMFSPDIFDSAAVMIDLCRERLHFAPIPLGQTKPRGPTQFRDLAKQVNRVYRNVQYAES